MAVIFALLAIIYVPAFIVFIYHSMKKIFSFLNPFGNKEGNIITRFKSLFFKIRKKELSDYEKKNLEKKRKQKKVIKKTEPFLQFRERSGCIFSYLDVVLHLLFYLQLFISWDITNFIRLREENVYAQIFTYLLIASPFFYWWLSKQPQKAYELAKEKLKRPFEYYYGLRSVERVSNVELQNFEEHFECRVMEVKHHRKGHFTNGIYHNQEFTYTVEIYVEDLDTGQSYKLVYPTDSEFKSWGTPYNKEYLTKKGMFRSN